MGDLSEKPRLSMGGGSTPDEGSIENGPPDKSQDEGIPHTMEPKQGSAAAAATERGDVEAQSPDPDAVSIAPPPVKVPRSQRRGLFGRITILAEVEEPKNYPRRTKWFITCVIALAAAAAPLGSTIFFRKGAVRPQPAYLVLTLLQHLLSKSPRTFTVPQQSPISPLRSTC